MANPSSSPTRAHKSERDNSTTPSDQAESSRPRHVPDAGAASAGALIGQAPSPAGASGSPRTDRAQSSSTGNGVAQKLRQQANARLSSQKDRALDGVEGVTEAIRQTTQSLRDRQHDTIAGYIEQVVGQIDRARENLRQKDVGQLITDAQRLARRQPALFIGSAFAIGLLGARFLKSSPPGGQRSESDYGGQRDHAQVWRAQQ
jgi:hypothetical protein